MKEYKLEENYIPGLPGFKEKSEELNTHIKRHLPLLNNYFVRASKFTLYRHQNQYLLRYSLLN